MAVFAPIPSASVKIAVRPNPQLLRKVRKANRTSCSKDSNRECKVCASSPGFLLGASLLSSRLFPPPEFPLFALALGCGGFSVALVLWLCGAACLPFVPSAARVSNAALGAAEASGRGALGSASWGRCFFEPVLDGFSCRAMRACPKYKNATRRTISHYLTFWYHPWVWLVRFGYWTNLYEFDVLVRFPCCRKLAFLASDFDFWLCVVILGRRSGRGCRV